MRWDTVDSKVLNDAVNDVLGFDGEDFMEDVSFNLSTLPLNRNYAFNIWTDGHGDVEVQVERVSSGKEASMVLGHVSDLPRLICEAWMIARENYYHEASPI